VRPGPKASANLAGNARINSFGASFGATINRIFAGTDGGIYSSSGEGRTWEKTSVAARTISFATFGNSIHAGTQSTGLLASKDQGMNWTSITSLASKNIRSLLAAQGRVYAGTDADGVMVSQDQGTTWTAQNAGLPPLSQIFAMAFIDNTIFAGLYNKAFTRGAKTNAAGPKQGTSSRWRLLLPAIRSLWVITPVASTGAETQNPPSGSKQPAISSLRHRCGRLRRAIS